MPSGAPSSSAPAAGKYTIQSGENLSVIAARYGWSWQQLYNYGGNRATVGSNPNVVKAGQVLDVPGGSAAPAPAPSVKTYTVRSDDNLSSIAAKYGLTWQQVYNYGNNKAVIGGNPDLIKVGQVLQIPA